MPTSTSAGTTPKVPVFHNDPLPERRLTEPTIPSMSLFSQPGQTPFLSGRTSHPVQEALQQRSNSLEAKPRGSIDSLPLPKLVTYMQPPQPAHASPLLSNPGPPPAQVIVYPQQQGPSLGPPPVTSSTKPVEAPMLVSGPTVPYGSQPISQQVALAGNPPPPPPPPPQQAEFYYASNPSNASQSQHYSKYYYSLNPITGEPIGVTAIPMGPTTGMIQSYPGGVPSGVAPMQPQPQVQAQNPLPPPPPQLGHGYSQQVGSTPGSAAYLGPPPGTHPNGYPMFHYGFHYMGMYDPNSVGTYGFDQNNALMNKRRIIKRRTRTGCLTCRRRRIKCDERKPECYNCERSGKVCLGYEIVDPLNMRRRNTVANGSLPSNASENEESRIKNEEKSQPGSPKKLVLEKDHQHDQDHDLQETTIKDRNNAKLLSVSNLLSQ